MKLYEWLLMLYPRNERLRFAEGMRAAFAADYSHARSRGRATALYFLGKTVVETLAAAAASRIPAPATARSFVAADIRDAVRSLAATPVVTVVAVLSLALGIGANTAIFTILSSLVLKPLPVAEPERLAILAGNEWTNPIWEQIRARQSDLFENGFAWSRERFNLAKAGAADMVEGAYVSGGMFHTLGTTAVIGRLLTPADDVRGGGSHGHVAVVSHQFWQQRLAGAPDVTGRSLTVNGVPFTIVGVVPQQFFGPEVGQSIDIYLPLASEAAIRGPESALDGRSSWWLQVMIRLRTHQTVQSAEAALNAVRPTIREATFPLDAPAERRATYLMDDFRLTPAATGASALRNRFAQPLTIIMVVVAAVLLIACANIANLMLARAARRRHEMTIRLALGASRLRLACQLLVESLLLAAVGAVAGLAIANVGASLLVRQLSAGGAAVSLNLTPDWRVLGFTAAIAAAATLLFGLAPAFGLGSVRAAEVLKEQSRTLTGDRHGRLRGALVVAQIAMSFALIAAAGLFVRTFTTLVRTPLGFDAERLLIVNINTRPAGLTAAEQLSLFERATEAVASVEGVSRASLSFLTPMSGRGWNSRIEAADGPPLTGRNQVAWVNAVGPGWFDTYGMRVLAGRAVTASDVTGGEQVAVVNESFARRFFPGRSPIGQQITTSGPEKKVRLIVGVVNDAVYRSVRAGVVPTMYLPIVQAGPPGAAVSITAKLSADRQDVPERIAEAVRRVAPDFMLFFRDYSDQVRATFVQERLVALLSGFFGGLAVLLAALGVYGVTSYAVSQRRPELAIRLALGASTRGVVGLVLGRVAVLIGLGLVIGMTLLFWSARYINGLLFDLGASDPLTLLGAATLLVTAGAFAAWLPARGVSRLDPVKALRQ
jgi:predicted permease